MINIINTSIELGYIKCPDNIFIYIDIIVTYTDEEDFDMKRERFLIQSISFNLGYDGLMSLSVSNINNLPFVY